MMKMVMGWRTSSNPSISATRPHGREQEAIFPDAALTETCTRLRARAQTASQAARYHSGPGSTTVVANESGLHHRSDHSHLCNQCQELRTVDGEALPVPDLQSMTAIMAIFTTPEGVPEMYSDAAVVLIHCELPKHRYLTWAPTDQRRSHRVSGRHIWELIVERLCTMRGRRHLCPGQRRVACSGAAISKLFSSS